MESTNTLKPVRPTFGPGTIAPHVYAACVLVLVVAAAVGPRYIERSTVSVFTDSIDFKAFYCAGRQVARGSDPYTVEPLRSCEVAATRSMGLQQLPGLVMPAPFPPYALVLFAALSALPYDRAVCFWFALLGLCTLASGLLLAKLSGLPPLVCSLTMVLGSLGALQIGQLAPIIVCLLLGVAFALKQGRLWLAAILASLAMLEPHIALPTCIALFVLVPATRVKLAVCATALTLGSLAFGPAGLSVEYVARVLPSQAMSEVHLLQAQYSLTTALASVGVPDRIALLVGNIQYFLTIAVALPVAKALSSVRSDVALLPLVPAAFVCLGGSYIHAFQFEVALPAILMLSTSIRPAERAIFGWCAAGIVTTIVLEAVFGSGFAHVPSGASIRDLLHVDSRALASELIRVWQAGRVTSDPSDIAKLVLIKSPAIAAVLAFVVVTTYSAYRIFEPQLRILKGKVLRPLM